MKQTNKPMNLRTDDVLDLPNSYAQKLPVSANQLRITNEAATALQTQTVKMIVASITAAANAAPKYLTNAVTGLSVGSVLLDVYVRCTHADSDGTITLKHGNKTAAKALFEYSGAPVAGDVIGIGTEGDVYEFQEAEESITAGHIWVNSTGLDTAAKGATALAAAIMANTTLAVIAAVSSTTKVLVTSTVPGTAANAITLSKTVTNGAWNNVSPYSNATLAGGLDAGNAISSAMACADANVITRTTSMISPTITADGLALVAATATERAEVFITYVA